jgi:general secretion pathway protein N
VKEKIIATLGLLVVFIVSAVVHLPASVIVKMVTLPNNIQLNGISGSVWRGQISHVQLPEVSLGKVAWQIDPSELIQGKIQANFRFGEHSSIQARGKGTFTLSPSVTSLSHFSLSMPVASFSPWLKTPLPISVAGNLSVLISDYQFDGNLFCSTISGQANWTGAQIDVISSALQVDNVKAQLHCDNQKIVADVEQQSQQVSSQFTLTLTAPNRYQVVGWFRPNASFPTTLSQQLKWLPAPDPNNRYQVSERGRW